MKKFITMALCCLFISVGAVAANAARAPEIISESAVVIDGSTGQVLYDKNANAQMYPASTTKIMTGLLAVEHGNMSDVFTVRDTTVNYKPKSASNIALIPGEEISLEGLMYGLAIESANDAANAIAEYVAGTQAEFAQMMTQRAKELGAVNTNFVNANGLHDPNHYTTAYDLALIAKECIKYPEFNTIFNTEKYTVPATNKQVARTFNSANWFINKAFPYEGIVMSKIGWTDEAMHTMVTACERDGVKLICVVMKSSAKQNKWDDTEKLFDWALEHYKKYDISGEYIALSADETMQCGDNAQLYVQRQDITCPGASVMLTEGDSPDSIRVEFSQPMLTSDMTTASMDATLYTGDGDSRVVLAKVKATAPVTERRTVYAPATVRVNKTSDMVMTVIFGVLTFTAVMICDILIKQRY